MTDLTTPAEIDGAADPVAAAHAWAKSGPRPWIVNGVDIADAFTALDTTGINGFAFNEAASAGLDAVFDGGEGYGYGWFARDRQTTVTLPPNATTTVYVGWDVEAVLGTGEAPADSENVILGLDADFAAVDPQIPLYELTTDDTTITNPADRRLLDRLFNDAGELSSRIDTALTGFTGPFRINNRTVYSEFEEYATVYNNQGAGWRFRDSEGLGDYFRVDSVTGNAEFLQGHLTYRTENRTSDPAAPEAGREWLRTDL